MDLNGKGDVEVVGAGVLVAKSGAEVDYEIRHGSCLKSASECDMAWSKNSFELFEFIQAQDYDDEYLQEVLKSIQMEDRHWNWAAKTFHRSSDEYEWFYLYAEGLPQGACLIYHPKDSVLTKSKIFYVEYIAVAPWNRDCLIRQRKFTGIGSILLKSAQSLAINNLGLPPGFSLRSLPQAADYYRKLKMVQVGSEDDGELMYFELPLNDASAFMEGL